MFLFDSIYDWFSDPGREERERLLKEEEDKKATLTGYIHQLIELGVLSQDAAGTINVDLQNLQTTRSQRQELKALLIKEHGIDDAFIEANFDQLVQSVMQAQRDLNKNNNTGIENLLLFWEMVVGFINLAPGGGWLAGLVCSTMVTWGVGFATASNPIGWIIAGVIIAGLIGALAAYLGKRYYQSVRESVNSDHSTRKPLYDLIEGDGKMVVPMPGLGANPSTPAVWLRVSPVATNPAATPSTFFSRRETKEQFLQNPIERLKARPTSSEGFTSQQNALLKTATTLWQQAVGIAQAKCSGTALDSRPSTYALKACLKAALKPESLLSIVPASDFQKEVEDFVKTLPLDVALKKLDDVFSKVLEDLIPRPPASQPFRLGVVPVLS